jgi:outer membrane lipoprotein-sorting protein
MKKIYLLAYLTLFIPSAYAETSLAQIQTYLNGFKTLKGDFEQQSPNGSTLRGQFAIQKPGKIRLDYSPPSSQLIFSNDGILYIYDRSSRDLSQMDLSQSLAEFLLRKNINFDEEGVKVKKFVEYDDTVELTLQKEGSEDIGELTLVFQKKPLQLIQWAIVDAQNQTTIVDIDNLKRNETFHLTTDPSILIAP